MTLADQVREVFIRDYAHPARQLGHRRLEVAVSDLNRTLGWSSRFPLICSALSAVSFHDDMGVKLIEASQPCPSSTTVFRFAVV